MAPPHMLEHMRLPASDTHVNRTGPNMGAKGGPASRFSTAFHEVMEIPGRWHQPGLQLSFISARLGEVLCKATMGLSKRNHPSG